MSIKGTDLLELVMKLFGQEVYDVRNSDDEPVEKLAAASEIFKCAHFVASFGMYAISQAAHEAEIEPGALAMLMQDLKKKGEESWDGIMKDIRDGKRVHFVDPDEVEEDHAPVKPRLLN